MSNPRKARPGAHEPAADASAAYEGGSVEDRGGSGPRPGSTPEPGLVPPASHWRPSDRVATDPGVGPSGRLAPFTPTAPDEEDAATEARDAEAELPEGVIPLAIDDPESIAGYALLGRIGAGGMGAVYLGLDGDQRVAIKLIRPEYALDPSFLARFHDEVGLADRVSPFCTAKVVDHGVIGGRPFLVTEYVEGLSLERQVIEHGALPAANLHGVAIGVAAALSAIHSAGLVHRDLKPANVILSWSGPRVIDFGIARALDSPNGRTANGVVLGSPGWMAPEQLAGAPVTPAADVFNWGCLVAFAGLGRHPFGDADPVTMAGRMMNEQPDLGTLEEPLRGLALVALSKDPNRRPSARELMLGSLGRPETALPVPDARNAVNEVLHRTWTPPPMPPRFRPAPAPPPPPRRNLVGPVLLGVIGAIVLVALLAFLVMRVLGGIGDSGEHHRTTASTGRSSPAATVHVDQPVQSGPLRFEVHRVRCGVSSLGPSTVRVRPDGQFCLASLEVANTGRQDTRLSSDGQDLVDRGGMMFKLPVYAKTVLPHETLWNTIKPGKSVSGTLVFDIPRRASPKLLRLRGPFGAKTATVRL